MLCNVQDDIWAAWWQAQASGIFRHILSAPLNSGTFNRHSFRHFLSAPSGIYWEVIVDCFLCWNMWHCLVGCSGMH